MLLLTISVLIEKISARFVAGNSGQNSSILVLDTFHPVNAPLLIKPDGSFKEIDFTFGKDTQDNCTKSICDNWLLPVFLAHKVHVVWC